MKRIVLGIAIAMSMNVFASTVEEAQTLWEARGEDTQNAAKAAEIYGALAASEADVTEKMRLLYKQSESIYYVGTRTEDKKEKMKIHDKGVQVAKVIRETLTGTDDFDQEEVLASGIFFFGANLGKWAEAKGITASLGRRKELMGAMEEIIDLGYEDLHEYGAHRILGRVLYKLPRAFDGDKDRSEALLKEAFENTLHDEVEVSTHGLNNLYYADVLKANKKKERACEILKLWAAQDPTTFDETRVPEAIKEIAQANERIAKFKCN